jgi:tetratricopeptide (TPR) repeat protein
MSNPNESSEHEITTGKIEGSGIIIGKNIHIEGDFVVTVSQEARSFGLNLLPPKYFEEHSSNEKDFEDWKDGFSVKLEFIKDEKELKRDGIINQIKNKLNNFDKLLLLGESGMSKSIILKEIICDYFFSGYTILYNLDEDTIKNPYDLLNFVNKLLKEGNKILVAIDNVQNEGLSTIFYIIDQLMNYQFKKNIKFILTARLPDFNFFLEEKINENRYAQSIRKIAKDPSFFYHIPPFSIEDIKCFIKKYMKDENIKQQLKRTYGEKYTFEEISKKIYFDTQGHPLMVKYSILKNGLLEDVRERYSRYLHTDVKSLHAMISCLILDISNLRITDELLEEMKMLEDTYNLENATLYQNEGIWKTINIRWDLELLSFLFNVKTNSIFERRKKIFMKAMSSILNIKSDTKEDKQNKVTNIAESLYLIARSKFIPTKLIDKVIEDQISRINLNADKLCYIYASVIAPTYIELNKLNDALIKCDKSLDVNSKYVPAWNNKGYILQLLKKYDDAIQCFDKALEIDPMYSRAWNNKGTILFINTKYDDAIQCFDKALEIDPMYSRAWNNKGTFYANMGKYDDAIQCFDKALEITPHFVLVLFNKGTFYANMGKYDDAIQCFDKALEIDPYNIKCMFYKSKCLTLNNRIWESIEILNKIIELDPNYGDAWFERSRCFIKNLKIVEGINDLESAIQLNRDKYIQLAKIEKDFEQLFTNERFRSLINNS